MKGTNTDNNNNNNTNNTNTINTTITNNNTNTINTTITITITIERDYAFTVPLVGSVPEKCGFTRHVSQVCLKVNSITQTKFHA